MAERNTAGDEFARDNRSLGEHEYEDKEGNIHHRSEKYIGIDEEDEEESS